jgi:transcriptional regulator GlxA family with amidase domain
MPHQRKPVICLLATPDTSPSVLYGLYDVLMSVGASYPDMTVGKPGVALLDVKIVAATGKPFRCMGDVFVEPHAALRDIKRTNVALVCDVYASIDNPPRDRYPQEIIWLKQMYAKGATVASVCSGALVLAESGLLDGRQCTAHWAYRKLFQNHYPKIELRDDLVLCQADSSGKLLSCGGATAWHDLTLHLIASLCGPAQAIRTAKGHLLSSHREGQLPFAVHVPRIQQGDAAIAKAEKWITAHYACANPVGEMATHSGLKPRTFARRFRSATGYLPIDYVHYVRTEKAKELIENRQASLEEVGAMVGYEDSAFFRRLFKRQVGLSPALYRRKYVDGIAETAKARKGLLNGLRHMQQ